MPVPKEKRDEELEKRLEQKKLAATAEDLRKKPMLSYQSWIDLSMFCEVPTLPSRDGKNFLAKYSIYGMEDLIYRREDDGFYVLEDQKQAKLNFN